jgi:hypothetical protein
VTPKQPPAREVGDETETEEAESKETESGDAPESRIPTNSKPPLTLNMLIDHADRVASRAQIGVLRRVICW